MVIGESCDWMVYIDAYLGFGPRRVIQILLPTTLTDLRPAGPPPTIITRWSASRIRLFEALHSRTRLALPFVTLNGSVPVLVSVSIWVLTIVVVTIVVLVLLLVLNRT